MGMYTELYLGLEIKKDIPMSLQNWLLANNKDLNKTYEEISKMCPNKELEETNLSTLAGGSYYFDAQQHYEFVYDDISLTYYLTMGVNIKNYDNDIYKFLKLITPYITTIGHIGHIRYEEHEFPTILMFDGENINYHGTNNKIEEKK